MKITPPYEYAYAVGKIRALEKTLINSEAFEQAVASDLKEALRIFVESGDYKDELLHITDSQGVERVLSKQLVELKRLVCSLILDKPLLNLIELNTCKCIEDVLRTFPNSFLRQYLMHVVDMHNIKTFLRLMCFKEPKEKLAELISCSGFIPREEFIRLYTKEPEVFLNRLEYVHVYSRVVDYSAYLSEGIEQALSEHSFIGLEKAINDFLIEVLRPAKYMSFGPEPILAYYFAKVNEIHLVRMVLLAKLNAVPTEIVMERLNSVYAT